MGTLVLHAEVFLHVRHIDQLADAVFGRGTGEGERVRVGTRASGHKVAATTVVCRRTSGGVVVWSTIEGNGNAIGDGTTDGHAKGG